MRYFSLVCVVILCGSLVSVGQVNPDIKIPFDSKVKTGKLANGLTYYIRQNKKPAQKVEMRLVINAGSLLETEQQQGIAHFSEHMAFNGTTHFKRNELVSFLQSIGVSFGNDLNAYTGFNETVYILPIPTDKPGNIEKGFQVIEDWAHNVTYEASDIDGERGVVLEESRMGKGADDRMFRKIYPKIFAGSLYSTRLPIGVDSIIKNQDHDIMRSFYKQWYRPDLMAVIIVGDIDPVLAEKMVREHFSRLKNPTNELPRNTVKINPYVKSEGLVVTDKEATDKSVIINYSFHPSTIPVTLGDFKNDLVKDIFTTILNQRLRELTQSENPPFVFASASFDGEARGYESFNGQISTGSGDPEKGLQAFITELERAKRFGLTQPELDRVKKSMENQMERLYNERDKTESSSYAQEYISYFLNGEPSPGIEKERLYYKELLPLISLKEVNALANRLKENANKLIVLTGPEENNFPQGQELLAVAENAEKADIKGYEEKALSANLMKAIPKAGKIVTVTKNAELGTTELKLSNGITVTLKTTDFKNDQVLMKASRAGGQNNYGIADKYNAQFDANLVAAMGVGDFSPVELRKMLAGKTVSVTPALTAITDGMNGNSSLKDMETMFQLTYLYFTAPRKDSILFKSVLQRFKSQVSMLDADPQNAFVDTLTKVMYANNPLAPEPLPKLANLEKIKLDRVMQIYKERFSDASGMNFTFVGNFTLATIEPLIEKYIASLPVKGENFHYVDNKVRPKEGKLDFNFNKGAEQKSLILAFYSGEFPYSPSLELKAGAVSQVLNLRIIDNLREKIQGIYSGGIDVTFEKVPYPNYQFILQLPCGPEKIDTLIYAMNCEIASLKKNGPTAAELEKVKQQWKEQHKEAMKDNATWLNELQELKFPGGDASYFLDYNAKVDSLTVNDIRDAANLLLNGKNVVTAILRPSATTIPGSGSKVGAAGALQ